MEGYVGLAPGLSTLPFLYLFITPPELRVQSNPTQEEILSTINPFELYSNVSGTDKFFVLNSYSRIE